MYSLALNTVIHNSLTVINCATPETFKCHNLHAEMTVNATAVSLAII